MGNMEKIKKQSALSLGIIIRFGLGVGILGAVIGVIYACGAPVASLVGIYLGYKLVKLLLRLVGLILSLAVTIISIIVLITIISLFIL